MLGSRSERMTIPLETCRSSITTCSNCLWSFRFGDSQRVWWMCLYFGMFRRGDCMLQAGIKVAKQKSWAAAHTRQTAHKRHPSANRTCFTSRRIERLFFIRIMGIRSSTGMKSANSATESLLYRGSYIIFVLLQMATVPRIYSHFLGCAAPPSQIKERSFPVHVLSQST